VPGIDLALQAILLSFLYLAQAEKSKYQYNAAYMNILGISGAH
jgi:hypothetical protein